MQEVKSTYLENMRIGCSRKEAVVLAARRHGLAIQTVLNVTKSKKTTKEKTK